MDKCLLISCLVLAQIRHNGKNYQVGDVVCLSANDKLFLEKAKYVRVATPDEIAQYEQKQNQTCQVGAMGANANSNSHLDNGAGMGDDSEPSPPVSEPAQTEPPAEPVANEPQPSEAVPPAEPVSVPEPVPALVYDKLTKAELIAQLTTRGIAHNPNAHPLPLTSTKPTGDFGSFLSHIII